MEPTNPSPVIAPTPVLPPPARGVSPIILALLVVIFLLASAATALLYVQNRQLQSQIADLTASPEETLSGPTPTPTYDPTASWDTYQNTALNYSISFPQIWKATSVAAGGGAADATSLSLIVDISDTTKVTSPYPYGVITIQGYGAAPSAPPNATKSEVTVNGINSTKYVSTNLPENEGLTSWMYLIPIPIGSYIEILFRSGSADTSSFDTFTQILSTFKFTQ